MPHRCLLKCSQAKHVHVFPNPKKYPERFKKWVQFVGKHLNNIEDFTLNYPKIKLCNRHFEKKYWNRNNRLNALAIPTLLINVDSDNDCEIFSSLSPSPPPDLDKEIERENEINPSPVPDEEIRRENEINPPPDLDEEITRENEINIQLTPMKYLSYSKLRDPLKDHSYFKRVAKEAIEIEEMESNRHLKIRKTYSSAQRRTQSLKQVNMSSGDDLETLALQLFDAGAVRLGDIEAKLGRRTPVYFDLRVIVSHPKIMSAIAEHLRRLASHIEHDVLCGVPYAALPFTAVMSVNTDTPMIMKRKETKLYATKKILEGVYTRNQRCLVVEDVVTSGGSLLETIETLREEGLVVDHAVVVLDREQGGVTVLKSYGVEIKSLFTMTQLVDILKNAGRITDGTAEIISDHIRGCQFGNNR